MEENFSKKLVGKYIYKNRKETLKNIKENRKKRSSKDEKVKEEKREYDIEWTEELFDYKKGMSINPDEYCKNLYYKNN